MSVIRPKPPEDPIRYVPSAALAAGLSARVDSDLTGRTDPDRLAPLLDRVRRELLADLERLRAGAAVAGNVDPTFIDMPERLLSDYGTRRPQSELFAVLSVARRIREAVDRVVVLGGGSMLAARAVCDACCHPFHNELSRGERGGRPRISFSGGPIDNDSAQGLLDLVALPRGGHATADLLQRWAVLLVDAGDDDVAAAAEARLFLAALADAVGGDRRRLAELVVPVTGPSGRLAALADGLGCADTFAIPSGVAGPSAALTAAVLLPAAIVGIDVVRLLEGAVAMNRRFREAPAGENPALQAAGVATLTAAAGGGTVRVLNVWSERLAALGCWYGRLVTGTWRGPDRPPILPVTLVAGRDAAAPVEDERRSRRLVTNVVVAAPRRDRLVVPMADGATGTAATGDGLGGRLWTDLLAAEVAGHRPTADILLPRIDEHTIGQLLQMLLLATAIEAGIAADR